MMKIISLFLLLLAAANLVSLDINLEKRFQRSGVDGITNIFSSKDTEFIWIETSSDSLLKMDMSDGAIKKKIHLKHNGKVFINHIAEKARVVSSRPYEYDLTTGSYKQVAAQEAYYINNIGLFAETVGGSNSKYCGYSVRDIRAERDSIYLNANYLAGYPLALEKSENGTAFKVISRVKCEFIKNSQSVMEQYLLKELLIYKNEIVEDTILIRKERDTYYNEELEYLDIYTTPNSIIIQHEDDISTIDKKNKKIVFSENSYYIPNLRVYLKRAGSNSIQLYDENSIPLSAPKHIENLDNCKLKIVGNKLCAFGDYVRCYDILPVYDKSLMIENIVNRNNSIRVNHYYSLDFEYSWDFGDGTGSNEAFPTKSYEEPGRYYVSLQVNTGEGIYSIADSIDVVDSFDAEIIGESIFQSNEEISLSTLPGNGNEKHSWYINGKLLSVEKDFHFTIDDNGIYKVELHKSLRDSVVKSTSILRICETEVSAMDVKNDLELYNTRESYMDDMSGSKFYGTIIKKFILRSLFYNKGKLYIEIYKEASDKGTVEGLSSGDFLRYDYSYNYIHRADSIVDTPIAINTPSHLQYLPFVYDFKVIMIDSNKHFSHYYPKDSKHAKFMDYKKSTAVPIHYTAKYFPVTFMGDYETYILIKADNGLTDICRWTIAGPARINTLDLHCDEIIPGSYTFFHQNGYTGILFRMTDGRIFAHTMQDAYTLSPPTVIVPDTDKGELVGYEPLLNGLILRYRNKGRNYEYRHRMGIEDGQVLFSEPWVYDITDYPVWIDGYYYDIHQLPNAVDSSLIMTEIRIYDSTHTHVHSYLPPQVYVPTEQLLADIDGKFYINSPESFTELGNIFPLPEHITNRTDDRQWDMSYLTVEITNSSATRYAPYSRDGRIIVPGLRPDVSFEVYDLSGRQVRPERQLSPGCYLVRIEGVTYKVMVE